MLNSWLLDDIVLMKNDQTSLVGDPYVTADLGEQIIMYHLELTALGCFKETVAT